MKLVGRWSWLLGGAALAGASCAAGTLQGPGNTGGGTAATGGATASGATASGGGTASSSGAASTSSSAGGTTTGTGGHGGGGGQGGCTTAADCPSPPNACLLATCAAGACGTQAVAKGTVITKDAPADCHATVCDGVGGTALGVDTNNVPASSNPCLVGTCDASGTPGTAPGPAGTACASPPGGHWCNGAGACVQCLHATDCPSGQACAATDACVPTTCLDGTLDGSETDVDCGGLCPPCAVGKACAVDQDCTSKACDAPSLTCVTDPCSDHHKDGDETDVDCGGSCPVPCGVSQGCALDADCASNACDAVTLTCDADQCSDARQDGDETDADCGGAICTTRCALGKMCLLDSDCVPPGACDGVSLTCVANQCLDHRQDGNESDVDCGGVDNCLRCKVGMKCLSATDCRPGLACSATTNTCG